MSRAGDFRPRLWTGDVEKRGVGEYAVEMGHGQIEIKEILLPYLAATIGAGHGGEERGLLPRRLRCLAHP
jgi:hypothetical protein